MNDTKVDPKLEARVTALVAILNEREQAKKATPEDNPYAEHTLVDLSHGLLKAADNNPAVNTVAKSGTSAAMELESARFATAAAGYEDKSNRRKAEARARAERKVEFDKIASSKTAPDPVKLEQAWMVVYWLVPIVTKIAKSKQRWANRLLGSHADDIPQMALEAMAMVLAKQTKFELSVLRQAAEEIGAFEKGIPGDQTVDESEPEDRKQVRKARKWLMGMVNNRVMGALVDSYTSVNNLKWDNLDIITTVVASISGVGDDPMLSRFRSDRAPAFLGTRFQRPGGIDPNALAMAISGAITAKGLDPLVEFMLNEENRRVDGAMEWSKHAQDIFLLTPGGHGAWMWETVVKSTESHSRPGNARGQAAMKHIRNLFEWLPSLIGTAIDSFDPHFISWSTLGQRAVLASDFELFYLGDKPGDELAEARLILEPALRYTSIEEAATALTEHLANLTDWKDMVR